MVETPFDSIESAHEYVVLLCHEVQTAAAAIEEEIAVATQACATRRLEALRIVDFKLQELALHLAGGRRLLQDLRQLRGALVQPDAPAVGAGSKAAV